MFKRNKLAQKPTFWADLLALALITAVGGLMHFTWENIEGISALRWTAALFPVNESNWEHAKMAAWPLLAWSFSVLLRSGLHKLKGWLMPTALCIWSAYAVMFTVHSALPVAFGELGFAQYIVSFVLGIAHGILVVLGRSASCRDVRHAHSVHLLSSPHTAVHGLSDGPVWHTGLRRGDKELFYCRHQQAFLEALGPINGYCWAFVLWPTSSSTSTG